MGRYGISYVLLASQVVTATGNSGKITLPALDVLALYFNVTAISGTGPSITFTVNELDPITGLVANAIISSVAIAAVSETTIQISPFMALVANKVAQNIVPVAIQIAWVVAGTTPSATFAVNAEY